MPSGVEVLPSNGIWKCLPSAADGVTVTPNGSSWVNSTYVQITAAIAHQSALVYVVAVPTGFDVNTQWEVDVATGGAGSETVIATVAGWYSALARSITNGTAIIPVPIDNIANGARVAVRLRAGTTDVNTWKISIGVVDSPLGSHVSTVTNRLLVDPSAANMTSSTTGTPAWTNGSWVQINASTSDARVLAAIAFSTAGNSQTEIDIGTGGAGAESVITTIRVDGGGSGSNGESWFVLRPLLDNIAASTRIAVRCRGTDLTTAHLVKLAYFNKTSLGNINNILTTKPLKWWPSAANPIQSPQSGTNWLNGAWTQFAASAAAPSSIVYFTGKVGGGFNHEIDIGTGGAGSEVSKTTLRLAFESGASYHQLPCAIPSNIIGNGDRVSTRVRGDGSNAAGLTFAIGYYENLDAGLITTTAAVGIPAAADNISVTPNGTAWNNSSWVQIIASTAGNTDITRIPYVPGVTQVEFEVDIGIGGAGAEAVLATCRAYCGQFSGGGTDLYMLIPNVIPISTRVAYRMRKAGTSVAAWTFAGESFAIALPASGGGASKGSKGGKGGGGGVIIQNPGGAQFFTVGNAGVGTES